MALHFLQTRSPPILPCLHEMYFQRLSTAPEQTSRIVIDGVDCSFFEDTEELQGFGDANKESLGELLYGFFRHYALDFDYNSSVVSVRHGRFLEKRDKGWDRDVPRMSRFLCVEEPFNPQRNLANSADLISVLGLRAEFRRALDILLDSGDLSAVCERYTPVASSALKIAAVPGYPACGKMKSDTFDHSINNNSGHARSFSASSVYYEPTATSQSGNGSSGRSHSGRSVRSFGTGMYPTQHKQQQTESGPVLWTPPPSSAYPTSQRNHYYSDSSMTSANQQYRVSANKWIKKGFYPGYYYGYPMVPPAAAPGIDQEAEEDGKLVAQDDEYTGTRATQTGADGDVEMHFPALGKVTNGSLANAVPTVENTPSLDSAESDSGLTKTPATTTVWATVDKKAYPKPSIPDAFKTVPAQTFATSSAASSKQKKHGPQHGRTQSLNVCQQSQSLLGEGEKKVKQQQRGHNIRRSNRKPTFVSLQLNGSSESKSELMSVSSESDSVSKAEAFPPRRVDSAKSVDDLAINGLTLSPSTATALDYLGAKKKGGKKTLVWSNNSHRHGRASSSTGSRMNGQMSDTSPQKTIREPVSVMKKVGSLESFKVPASVTTSRDKYVGVHVRSRSLSEGRDLAR